MATSGRAIAAAPPPSGASGPGHRDCGLRRKLVGLSLVCGIALVAIGGCATSVKMGTPPPTDRLSELTVGVSTAKDVVAVLGNPQGRGAVRAPSFGLKDAWLYESAEIEGSRAHMRMLMVFLDKDTGVYQGNMWMASGLLFGQTR